MWQKEKTNKKKRKRRRRRRIKRRNIKKKEEKEKEKKKKKDEEVEEQTCPKVLRFFNFFSLTSSHTKYASRPLLQSQLSNRRPLVR